MSGVTPKVRFKQNSSPRKAEPKGVLARPIAVRGHAIAAALTAVVTATVLAACGNGHPAAGGNATRGSHPAPSVTLGVAANNSTVRLAVGHQLAVALARQGGLSWHVPAASGAGLRQVSAGGGYPGHQPARATFTGVSPGRVVLTSISDAACLHATPACMIAQQAWRVTVIVTRS
jgi:hypothetical protein